MTYLVQITEQSGSSLVEFASNARKELNSAVTAATAAGSKVRVWRASELAVSTEKVVKTHVKIGRPIADAPESPETTEQTTL